MNVTESLKMANGSRRGAHAEPLHDALDPQHSGERTLHISLKQWRLFQAVVDNDGFVGAANKLHVSQSSISHALAKLQDQLGVPLLLIRGRKAHITEEGKTLLARSRDLVRQAAEIEELGELMRRGWEPGVRVAVEPNYPAELLMRAFFDMNRHSHKLRLQVKEVDMTTLRQLLHLDQVDLAISSATLSGFASNKLIEMEHVAVAHAHSPLFSMDRTIRHSDLNGYLQIVFCTGDSEAVSSGANASMQGQHAWKVSSLDNAAEALRFGMSYAWLPRYRVQRWLDDGWARIIPLDCGYSYTIQMHLIRGRAVVPGSGAQRFADMLQATTNDFPTPLDQEYKRGRTTAGEHGPSCSC